MKTPLAVLALTAFTFPVLAQDFEVVLPDREEVVVETIDPRPSIEGIVKDVFVTRRPWQLVNPAAPARYGSGQRMVSKDFGPGTPVHSAGVVVAGVEW